MDTARKPTIHEKNDAILNATWREERRDWAERRRQRLRDLRFSETAVFEDRIVGFIEPGVEGKIGVASCYLEDESRAFKGLDLHATDKKSGRKRKRAQAKARTRLEALYGADSTSQGNN